MTAPLHADTETLSEAIHRALEIEPDRQTGTLQDVAHVVILMQENRSFDHYFGAFPGARGFSDPHVVPTRAGNVLTQTDGQATSTPYALHAQYPSGHPVGYITPHTWTDAQQAWNDGRMDQWLIAKSRLGMGAYQGDEIPFQTALARAFTLCDAYHCSIHAGTNPNRLFLWTGTNDPQAQGGGPALVNTFDRLGPSREGYSWTTYPERLQAAGIDWRIYQDMADNYHDNPLAGFKQYRRENEGNPSNGELRERALSTHTLEDLARDAAQGTLPQVSWIIASTADSEHPEVSSPRQGAVFTERVLDILTRAPDTWSRTVLFVTYDENDCFFDHMPPPAPPARNADHSPGGLSTVSLDGEYHDARIGPSANSPADPPELHGRAFGLGPRVPMLVVSPWTRGGWINSQVFDHTSVIRFLETRFGVMEPNISEWRRTVCGDLISAFDFAQIHHNAIEPKPGHSRALPYDLQVQEHVSPDGQHVRLVFRNHGSAGAVFHVYDKRHLDRAPRRYTVGAGDRLEDMWGLGNDTAFDLWILGPDGFHRHVKGDGAVDAPVLDVTQVGAELRLSLHNPGNLPQTLHADSHLGAWHADITLAPGARAELMYSGYQGWFDLEIRTPGMPSFLRRWAGRLATTAPGVVDPRLLRATILPAGVETP